MSLYLDEAAFRRGTTPAPALRLPEEIGDNKSDSEDSDEDDGMADYRVHLETAKSRGKSDTSSDFGLPGAGASTGEAQLLLMQNAALRGELEKYKHYHEEGLPLGTKHDRCCLCIYRNAHGISCFPDPVLNNEMPFYDPDCFRYAAHGAGVDVPAGQQVDPLVVPLSSRS
jgi:hypothetical protein